jgi:hypothetical protein
VVRPQDETKGSGDGGIAENIRMVDRIDAIETAPVHMPAALAAGVAVRPSRGINAESDQGGDSRERDTSFGSAHRSIHGDLLLGSNATPPDVAQDAWSRIVT